MPLTLLSTLSGHTDRVWCCAYSPNGVALATCGGDKQIRIWTEEGEEGKREWKCRQVLEGTHSRTIRWISWSPNGKYLASAGFDGITGIWERGADGDFECTTTLEGHENEVKCVSWNRSGTLISTCSRDKSVWIWTTEEFECASVLNGHTQDVKVAKWHPTNESMLISASYDNTLKVWCEDGDDWYATETLTDHTSTVWGLTYNRDGSQFASCSDDRTIIVWERTASTNNTTAATTTKDPNHLANGGGSWKNRGQLAGHHSRCIYTVDWSKEKSVRNLIASGAADDSICIYGATPSAGAPNVATTASSSPSPAAAAVASTTATPSAATATTTTTPRPAPSGLSLLYCEKNAHSGDVNCVVWNPVQSNLLSSAGDDGTVKVWRWTP